MCVSLDIQIAHWEKYYAAWSSSDDSAMGYVLPVLWMTSYLPIVG